jgi:SAM-dependent methyltransferase
LSQDEWALRDVISQDADKYYGRNSQVAGSDRVLEALRGIHERVGIRSLLELGAFDGSRLKQARLEFGCRCVGVEASQEAVTAARGGSPDVDFHRGVVPQFLEEELPDTEFDVVVLGFFLYLLPRSWLFRLASSVDRLLALGGHLIVYDFLSDTPSRRNYSHDYKLTTFKMDYSAMWTWNPQYTLMSRQVASHDSWETWPSSMHETVCIDIIRKQSVDGSYLESNP